MRIASDDTNTKPRNVLLKAATTPNMKGSKLLPMSPLKLIIPMAAPLANWSLLRVAVVMFGTAPPSKNSVGAIKRNGRTPDEPDIP